MTGTSGGTGAAATLRGLRRDPTAVAAVAIWALLALPYALRFDQAWLARYQLLGLFPALLALVVVACLQDLRRVESWQERRFWLLIGIGFAAWLVSYAPYYVIPGEPRNLPVELFGEASYLFFYSSLLLAADLRPHLATSSRAADVERGLRSAGAVVLSFAALLYFVVVPVTFNPQDYATWQPSLLLYIGLDTFVLLRFVVLAVRCGAPRWRLLYGGLALATLLMLAADALEYLGWAGVLRFEDGRPSDLIWTVPIVAYALVARLRHLSVPVPPAIPFLDAFESSPAGTGSFLLLCALSLPAVHFTLYVAGLLDPSTHALREWVALGSVLILGAVAAVAYRTLDRERLNLRLRQQRLETRLRRVEQTQAVGRLAEGLTHDFSNLLQVIGGRCDPVLAQVAPDSPIREDLEAIRDASRRMMSLAMKVFDLVRKEFAPPSLVRLSDILGNAARLVQSVAGDQVRVETRSRARRDLVRVDPQQIERVMLAIVANARDAMPDGGTLAIETFDIDVSPRLEAQLGLLAGPYAAIGFTDTGSGMSEETLARAFQPFFTTRPEAEHAGLGLTTALHIASHYGGTILIDSGLGRGTTVTLYLPRAEAKVVDTAPAGSVEDTLRLRTVVPHLSGEH